jgi:hypothetical protein
MLLLYLDLVWFLCGWNLSRNVPWRNLTCVSLSDWIMEIYSFTQYSSGSCDGRGCSSVHPWAIWWRLGCTPSNGCPTLPLSQPPYPASTCSSPASAIDSPPHSPCRAR